MPILPTKSHVSPPKFQKKQNSVKQALLKPAKSLNIYMIWIKSNWRIVQRLQNMHKIMNNCPDSVTLYAPPPKKKKCNQINWTLTVPSLVNSTNFQYFFMMLVARWLTSNFLPFFLRILRGGLHFTSPLATSTRPSLAWSCPTHSWTWRYETRAASHRSPPRWQSRTTRQPRLYWTGNPGLLNRYRDYHFFFLS